MREQVNQELLSRLIGLARATEGNEEQITEETKKLLFEGIGDLFRKESSVSFERLLEEKKRIVPNCFDCASPCGRTADYDMQEFWETDDEKISLKLDILKGLESGKVQDADTVLYALIVLGWNGSMESLKRVLDKMKTCE